MSKVTFDISLSLDGFMTAANQRPEEPMGDGGQRLVEWAFGEDERDRKMLTDGVASIGAVIAGRRTFDDSVPWWGADGPTGAERLPVFVVSHRCPTRRPTGGVYTFVTGGIESALEQAKAAAGEGRHGDGRRRDRPAVHRGRAGGRALDPRRAGALGSGTRMFENLGDAQIPLETIATVQTAADPFPVADRRVAECRT